MENTMKYSIENMLINIYRVISNIFSQFEVDKIVIGDKERDYYNNYYLKGLKHSEYTTNLTDL